MYIRYREKCIYVHMYYKVTIRYCLRRSGCSVSSQISSKLLLQISGNGTYNSFLSWTVSLRILSFWPSSESSIYTIAFRLRFSMRWKWSSSIGHEIYFRMFSSDDMIQLFEVSLWFWFTLLFSLWSPFLLLVRVFVILLWILSLDSINQFDMLILMDVTDEVMEEECWRWGVSVLYLLLVKPLLFLLLWNGVRIDHLGFDKVIGALALLLLVKLLLIFLLLWNGIDIDHFLGFDKATGALDLLLVLLALGEFLPGLFLLFWKPSNEDILCNRIICLVCIMLRIIIRIIRSFLNRETHCLSTCHNTTRDKPRLLVGRIS